MNKLLWYFVISTSCLISCKQQERGSFSKVYGNGVFNEANDVIACKDGGYLLTGYTIDKDDPNVQDVPFALYTVRIDINGKVLWDKRCKLSDFDEGIASLQTADSNFVIAGQTQTGNGDMDILLVKLNKKGDTLWTKSLGTDDDDETSNALLQTTDGGYLIVGSTGLTGLDEEESPKSMYAIQTDAQGKPIWTVTYTKNDQSVAMDVKPTNNGYIIAGTTTTKGAAKEDMLLLKINTKGDTIWSKTFGTNDADFGVSVLTLADGYLLGGTSKDSMNNQKIVLIKTDTLGNVLWQKRYGGKEPQEFSAFTNLADGGFGVLGNSFSTTKDCNQFFLMRTNEKGDTSWTHTYLSDKNETAHAISITPDKGFLLSGAQDANGRSFMYVIKTDVLGNLNK